VEAELYLWGQEHGKKGNGMMDTEHFSIETDPTWLLLDSRVVGFADVIQPHYCHTFIVEALLFQWP
jgi:hypothetical protein